MSDVRPTEPATPNAARRRSRLFLPVALALSAMTAVVAFLSRSDEASSAPCPPPFEALGSGSCLATPPGADKVIVYLHGMTTSSALARKEAASLAAAALERGFAILAPIGTHGGCTWSPEFANRWCWPIAPEQAAETEALLERIRKDLEHVSPRPSQVVLAGFSNGGFMALRLARLMPELSGLVVAQAGAPRPFSFDGLRPVPTLLLAARGDEWQFPTMKALRATMDALGWAPEWQERGGPHAMQPEDFAAMVTFIEQLSLMPAENDGSVEAERRHLRQHARHHLRARRWSDAARAFETLAHTSPKDAFDSFPLRATALVGEGRVDEALRLAEALPPLPRLKIALTYARLAKIAGGRDPSAFVERAAREQTLPPGFLARFEILLGESADLEIAAIQDATERAARQVERDALRDPDAALARLSQAPEGTAGALDLDVAIVLLGAAERAGLQRVRDVLVAALEEHGPPFLDFVRTGRENEGTDELPPAGLAALHVARAINLDGSERDALLALARESDPLRGIGAVVAERCARKMSDGR